VYKPFTGAGGSHRGAVHALVLTATVVAVVANTAFVWPQAVKVVRTRDVDGVSPTTWCISMALFSVWAAFAARTGYVPLLVANASCWVAATLVLVAGTRGGWPWRYLALGAASMAAAGVLAVLAPAVLAVVMTVAGIALRVPQLAKLLRSEDVDGVSATTWALGALTAGSWLVVSTSRGAWAVVVANSTALVSTLVLLAVLAVRRRSGAGARS